MLLEWLVLTTLLLLLAWFGTQHALREGEPWSSLHRSDALIRDTVQPLAAIAASAAVVLVEAFLVRLALVRDSTPEGVR